jgi:hypothetical protein
MNTVGAGAAVPRPSGRRTVGFPDNRENNREFSKTGLTVHGAFGQVSLHIHHGFLVAL